MAEDQDANDLQWFVLLRAAERYREAYGRYPGDLYTESDHALDPSNANIAAPIDTMENEVRRFKVFRCYTVSLNNLCTYSTSYLKMIKYLYNNHL